MTRKIAFIALIMFVSSISLAVADSDDAHGKPIEEVLQEIRDDLGLKNKDDIDPDKVDDELLEELGEAVMSEHIPDPRQHEWMDEMMGGEGSESLAAMHKNMGFQYLKSGGVWGPGGMMMGGGMMGSSSGGMMGSRGWRYRSRDQFPQTSDEIDEILLGIRNELGLDEEDRINPDVVDDEDLEKLGDAVMALNFANPRDHEWMDEMMGGEDSRSLAAMHVAMGYRYLSSENGWGPGSMMGPGYRGMMMGGSMMGYSGHSKMPGFHNSELTQKINRRLVWGSVVPWTIAGVLSATVAVLSVVIATR